MRKVRISPAVLANIYNVYSNHRVHQAKTRQNKSHKATVKHMVAPPARSFMGKEEKIRQPAKQATLEDVLGQDEAKLLQT